MIKILIIEDDVDILDNIQDLLKLEGNTFELASATNGKEGLSRIEQFCPDLIICDINMPQMNGLELVKILRSRKILTPFIFLSADARPDRIREGMTLGADDYLTKPFTRQSLLNAIYSRLERLQDVRDFVKAEKAEVRRELLRGIPDELGNLVNAIAACFHEYHDAETPEEAQLAYRDGIKSIATLAATLKAYYRSIQQ